MAFPRLSVTSIPGPRYRVANMIDRFGHCAAPPPAASSPPPSELNRAQSPSDQFHSINDLFTDDH